jgi:hypothetical protein
MVCGSVKHVIWAAVCIDTQTGRVQGQVRNPGHCHDNITSDLACSCPSIPSQTLYILTTAWTIVHLHRSAQGSVTWWVACQWQHWWCWVLHRQERHGVHGSMLPHPGDLRCRRALSTGYHTGCQQVKHLGVPIWDPAYAHMHPSWEHRRMTD